MKLSGKFSLTHLLNFYICILTISVCALFILVLEDIYLLMYEANGPDDAYSLRNGNDFSLEDSVIESPNHRRKHSEIDDVEMAFSLVSDNKDDIELTDDDEEEPLTNSYLREISTDSGDDVFYDALCVREYILREEHQKNDLDIL